jgi:signal transduction histidine kinase
MVIPMSSNMQTLDPADFAIRHQLHERAIANANATRMNRLLDVTTALSDAESSLDVAKVVINRGLDVLEATTGLVAVMDGDELRMLDWRASTAPSEAMPSRIAFGDDGPVAEALCRREPVWLDSSERWRTSSPVPCDRILGTDAATSILAIPLLHGREIVGAIALGFDAPTAFGASDRTFALLLAQSAAAALVRVGALEREHRARLEAEMMSHAREEVLGVVAHDLRNPLGIIGGNIALVRELDLAPPARDKLLAAAERAVHQMNRLVSDLLDVTRLENGRLALETTDVGAATLLAEAGDAIGQAAAAKRISITVSPCTADLRVVADRGRVAQVFSNLLGNAVKFTPEEGSVTLRAWRDGREVIFEVADTGPGVSPENQAHLFDRFWQARASDLRGIGLGLAISKAIVEAHHGRMWVESDVGAGSRFYFALPAPGAVADV